MYLGMKPINDFVKCSINYKYLGMKLPKVKLIVSTPIFTSIKYVEDLLNLRWKIKPTQQQTAKSSSNLAGSTDV